MTCTYDSDKVSRPLRPIVEAIKPERPEFPPLKAQHSEGSLKTPISGKKTSFAPSPRKSSPKLKHKKSLKKMKSLYSETVYTFYDSVQAGHLEGEGSEEKMKLNVKSKKSPDLCPRFEVKHIIQNDASDFSNHSRVSGRSCPESGLSSSDHVTSLERCRTWSSMSRSPSLSSSTPGSKASLQKPNMNFKLRRPPHVLCELELPRCESVPIGQKRSGMPPKSLDKLQVVLDERYRGARNRTAEELIHTSNKCWPDGQPINSESSFSTQPGVLIRIRPPLTTTERITSKQNEGQSTEAVCRRFIDRRQTREMSEDVESVWSLKWDVKPIKRMWDAKAGVVRTIFEGNMESPMDTPH